MATIADHFGVFVSVLLSRFRSHPKQFILDQDGQTPILVPYAQAVAWHALHTNVVAKTTVGTKTIITCLTPYALATGSHGEPQPFATFVTDMNSRDEEYNHATWDQAAACHARVVDELRAGT